MKRAIASGLVTFLSLFPSTDVSAKTLDRYDYTKGDKSGINKYTSQETISIRTTWYDETKSAKVSDYPSMGWDTIILYNPKKNAINFQIVSPEKVHERYIELFNRGISEIGKKSRKKKDYREKLNVKAVMVTDISDKSDEKEVTCYQAEIENTPLPNWRIFISDYPNDQNPPEIEIKPDKGDLFILLEVYKKVRNENEEPKFKLEY